jgi:FixJ family two-component response regulator
MPLAGTGNGGMRAHAGDIRAARVRTKIRCGRGDTQVIANATQLIGVVEDDVSMQRALRRLLHAGGYHTVCAGSAEELQSARAISQLSCLVLDVQLPGVSGPGFYGQLGATRPPAVFITAHDGPAVRLAIRQAGGGELLAKPFGGQALLDAVTRAIGPQAHGDALPGAARSTEHGIPEDSRRT